MVEACHQICPSARRACRATSSTAPASESIVITTSAPSAAAAGSSRTSTPSSRSASALPGLRFQARTALPASARLRAIGAPMTPVPSTAMVAMGWTLSGRLGRQRRGDVLERLLLGVDAPEPRDHVEGRDRHRER
jgi:hypothetical protein